MNKTIVDYGGGMNSNHQMVRVTERSCGGWLAVSGEDEPIKIGVTASTEEEATEKFAEAVAWWRSVLCLAGCEGFA